MKSISFRFKIMNYQIKYTFKMIQKILMNQKFEDSDINYILKKK